MKISASYLDFRNTVEKAQLELGLGVFQLIKPITKESTVDGETVIEYRLEFQIIDDRMGYNWKYEFDKQELKQFITLLQQMQIQLQSAGNDEGNNSGTCSGQVIIK